VCLADGEPPRRDGSVEFARTHRGSRSILTCGPVAASPVGARRRAVSVGCDARMHRGERGNGVAGRSRLKAGLILRVVWIVRDLVRSGDSGAADDTVAARAPLHRGPITSRKAQASGILITVMTATTRMASLHSHPL
jgi:hypothetical protein